MKASAPSLRKTTIAAYGLGDLGFNLLYTTLSLFLLIYYTNVLNIPPATAGLMAAGPVLWDALTDPVMGLIASRTRTRMGRYRPYMLIGAPLCGLSFVAMFAAPVLFPSSVIAVSVAAHLLFRTLYTVVNVPYTAMTVVLTGRSDERGLLAASRMVCAILAGLCAAIMMFPAADIFGNGDLERGFVWVSMLYAGMATIFMLVVVFTTSETTASIGSEPPLKLTDTLRFLRRNTAFWVLAAAIFLESIGSTIGLNAINYYVTDYVGADGQQGLVLFPLLVGIGVAIPVWTYVANATSKARAWILSGIPGILVGIVLVALAPTDLTMLAGLMFAKGFFAGAGPVLLWSMVPDTVEFGEWRSGVRDEAIGFGLIQLSLKSASSLAALLLGVILATIGYVSPEVRGAPLAVDTLEGIRFSAFLVPLALSVLGLVAISQYRLDFTLHDRIKNALIWRTERSGRTTRTG